MEHSNIQGDHGKDYQPDLKPYDGDQWNRNPAPPSGLPDDSTHGKNQRALSKRVQREQAELEY